MVRKAKIREYWHEIQQNMWEITGSEIPDDPWFCLFHNVNITKNQYKNSVTPYLINAAKGAIPRTWLG